MPQPYDYSQGIPDPNQSILGALQLKQAVGAQQIQQQNIQANQGMRMDMATLAQDPTPTKVAAAMIKYPTLADGLKPGLEALTTQQRDNKIQQASGVYAAIQAGQPDIAKQQLLDNAQAARNAGDENQAKALEAHAQLIDLNPKTAQLTAGIYLASAMGADKFADTFGKLDDQRRADDLAPSAVQKSQADATTAGVTAANAPQAAQDAHAKSLSDILNANTDIKQNPDGTWVKIDKRTGIGTPISNPQGQVFNGGASDLHGEDYLSSIDPKQANIVKALGQGRMQFPTGAALKSPYWQNMLTSVGQYDPSFDAVNYNARSAARKDFTSGNSAKSINALNTVAGHLNALSDAADGLNNTSFPLVNNVKNYVSSNVGNSDVKKFDLTRKAVVDELTRAYRGSGGSEGDIKSWTDSLGDANSPQQLHDVIGQIGELLESKINALGDQYNQGMGTTSQPISLVSPKARQTLDKLQGRASSTTVAPPAQAAAAAAPNALPATVASPAHIDALLKKYGATQ